MPVTGKVAGESHGITGICSRFIIHAFVWNVAQLPK
jgi:hypothetical protein